MKIHLLAGAVLASALCASAANADSYFFNVTYSGGGVGVQDLGSDDILSTTMFAGDDFTYTLTADGAGEWKVLTADEVFPLIALPTNESADRNVDFTLTLFNDGASVFSTSGNENVSEVHIGTNSLALTPGLIFDQWVLNVVLNSAFEVGTSTPTDTTPGEILPIFGPADVNRPDVVSYSATGFTAGVPEPAAWALMIAGFGMAGAMVRQKRRAFA
ncbi:PEPxxWA-CTERM sorting domain-containing protein [Phenylobacterium sp.]|uniref:PEPxxWA-CTERM sorting domain-containing protein n=1 Tax=Phenylobacterium sp. TaxID=1871053 RepID=UPI0025E0F11B|nr:PEPxxWA-CTERM sorting domain-containing protein [Phenylobacterium sp.]